MPPKQQGMAGNPMGLQALVLPWAAITRECSHEAFLQSLGKGQGQGNPHEMLWCSGRPAHTKLSHEGCQPRSCTQPGPALGLPASPPALDPGARGQAGGLDRTLLPHREEKEDERKDEAGTAERGMQGEGVN